MKVKSLVDLLPKYKLDAYLIPSTDEYLSEYAPEHLRRLEFITDFSGSNGMAIISEKHKALLTDGRYLLQATKQLPEGFIVLDLAKPSDIKEFLQKLKGYNIGYNPFIFSRSQLKIFDQCEINLKSCEEDLIDRLWERTPKKTLVPYQFKHRYAGKHSNNKIQRLLKKLNQKADYILITEPDAICWLLNIRGYDYEYSPLVLAQLLIHKSGEVILFSEHNFTFNHDFTVQSNLCEHLEEIKKRKEHVQLDSKVAPVGFVNILQDNALDAEGPINQMKMIKNEVEIAGFRKAHKTDANALQKFMAWLRENFHQGFSEYQLAQKLEDFRRKESEDFIMPSFATIMGYAENGAVIHYKPESQDAKIVGDSNLLLIDSGAHYKTGTTDVTRTIHLGKPTEEQRKFFTLVLKGQLALSMTKFPKGTTGQELDAIARKPLQDAGVDYPHGTGHGVGHVLSVHEGPCRISKIKSIPLAPGMVLSNEPGYYKPGEYGIRHEDLLLVINDPNDQEMLGFEVLTKAPIQMDLVITSMLSAAEMQFLSKLYLQPE